MLQLDIALRYRVHKLQLQTWGFPEVGPWHILSHSFASSESALFPGKKKSNIESFSWPHFQHQPWKICRGNWQWVIHLGKISPIRLRCMYLKVHRTVLKADKIKIGKVWTELTNYRLGSTADVVREVDCIQFSLCVCCPNWPRHKGFQGKTCWNLHGSGHFVKRIYTLRSLVHRGWSCMFMRTLVIGIIKLAKEKIHLQHHLDPFLKNIIEA